VEALSAVAASLHPDAEVVLATFSNRIGIFRCLSHFVMQRSDSYRLTISTLACCVRLGSDKEAASVAQLVHFTSPSSGQVCGDVSQLSHRGRAVFDGSDAAAGVCGAAIGDETAQVRPLLSLEEAVLFPDVANPIGQCR
jgi:hypothetical protein